MSIKDDLIWVTQAYAINVRVIHSRSMIGDDFMSIYDNLQSTSLHVMFLMNHNVTLFITNNA